MNEFGFVADAPDVGFVPDSTESDDLGFVPEATPLGEDNLPADMSARQRKRLELASELAAERARSDVIQADIAETERQERSIGNFTGTGLVNLPGKMAATIAGYGEHFTPTKGPLVPITVPADDPSVLAGVGRVGAGLLSGITDPDVFVTLPAFGGGAIPKALATIPMVQHLPEQVEQAVTVVRDPKSTPADITEAVLNPVATGAMLGGIGHSRLPKRGEPGFVADVPEFKGLPDPDLVARNLAEPGTMRPQEQQLINPPTVDPNVYQFEAGNVPFERMQRMGGVKLPPVEILPKMGRIENVPILEETRPKEQLETRGKVSFGAEAPTLLRTAVEQAETVGLTKSAEAAKKVSGESKMPPYQKPKEFTAERAAQQERKAAKAAVEEGLTMEQPAMEPLPPEVGQFPADGMPTGTLSRLQRSRILAKQRREASGSIPEPQQPRIEPRKTYPPEVLQFWNDNVGLLDASGSKTISEISSKSLRSAVGSLEQIISGLERAGLDASKEYRILNRADVELTKRGEQPPAAGFKGSEIPPSKVKASEPIKAVKPVEAAAEVATTTTLPEAVELSKRPSVELESELAAAREAVRLMPKPDPKEIAGMTQEQLATFLDSRSKAKIDAATKVQALEEALKLSKEAEKAHQPGLLSRTKAEAWADEILGQDPRTKTRALLDPIEEGKRIAAFAIKGAAVIERGVRDFAKWSEEMVNKYGPDIKDSLKQIYDQSIALIEKEKTEKVVPSSGTAVGLEKMRKSAERATTAEMIPEPVQETIKTAPESRYNQQSMNRVEEVVGGMDDAQLGTVSKETDIYTAAKLEQARRLFEKGDNDAGYKVFVELEKEGTRLGQLINQFKLLDGTRPEQVASVIDSGLRKAGKDGLTPAQTAEAIKIAKDAKAKDGALTAATEAWKAEPTKENAAKAEKALEESNKAALELQRFTAKFTPRTTSSILKSVLQGNLLTPISETANLVGNLSFLPFRAATRGIASGLDIIDSYITGKPREISVGPVSGTAEAAKGAARGAKQIPDILARGSGDVIKGESRAGLHPMKAWVDQFSKNPERPTEGGKLKLQDRLNLLIEGTFGVPAEAMLRGLGAGDAPFKEAARGRVIAEQLRLKKIPRDQWDFAQKFPELFFDKETVAQIGRDTAAAVFQRESKTLSLMTRWLSGKGDVIDFAAATVAPYKLTPWNIIGEVLSYNPMVALARTVYEAKNGNRKAAKLNAGKMLVGSMMAGSAAWLYQKGLIAPSLDERDEAQKARVLSGQVLPPNHINISGLKRAMEGGDPSFKSGDETRDFFRSGGLMGSMLYMTANVGRDLERKPDTADQAMSILRQSTLEQARFGINQSFLQGVEGLLTAIKEGNPDNYLRQWFSTVLSIPLPNSMATLSRATREYKPDFREDEFKKQIGNVIKNRLGFAGYDDYLPLKRDFWGKPIPETPKDRNALFYHFFDVTKGQQVTDDPVALELYRLWRKTADSKVIPSLVEKEIRRGNQSSMLDATQQSRYAELVGAERRRIVDAMVINPNFHKLSDENKIKVLTRAYDTGLEIGKLKFLRENPALEQKPKRAGFAPSQ